MRVSSVSPRRWRIVLCGLWRRMGASLGWGDEVGWSTVDLVVL